MSITRNTLKLLWGRSGGLCAYCGASLTRSSLVSGEMLSIANQAHIIAQTTGGPRGEGYFGGVDRDGYDNLILLCPTHHALIDRDPTSHPPHALRRMKLKHESWVQQTLKASWSEGGGKANAPSRLRLAPIFTHFLDHYFLEMKSAEGSHLVAAEATLATRLALLAGDCLLVPAAAYAESHLCAEIVDSFQPLYPTGALWLIGAGTSIADYSERKLAQYPKDSSHSRAYVNLRTREVPPPFLTRSESATGRIIHDWSVLPDNPVFSSIADLWTIDRPQDFENRWLSVPERLEGQAFIVDHVLPLLGLRSPDLRFRNRLHAIINQSYYAGFIDEFHCGLVADLVYLRAPFDARSQTTDLPYRPLASLLSPSGFLQRIVETRVETLLSLREDPEWQTALRTVLEIDSWSEAKGDHDGEGNIIST